MTGKEWIEKKNREFFVNKINTHDKKGLKDFWKTQINKFKTTIDLDSIHQSLTRRVSREKNSKKCEKLIDYYLFCISFTLGEISKKQEPIPKKIKEKQKEKNEDHFGVFLRILWCNIIPSHCALLLNGENCDYENYNWRFTVFYDNVARSLALKDLKHSLRLPNKCDKQLTIEKAREKTGYFKSNEIITKAMISKEHEKEPISINSLIFFIYMVGNKLKALNLTKQKKTTAINKLKVFLNLSSNATNTEILEAAQNVEQLKNLTVEIQKRNKKTKALNKTDQEMI